MPAIILTKPVPSFAQSITQIDSDGLATGHASFREDAYNWETFSGAYLSEKGFALVALVDEQVVGWAGVAKSSDRCVYAGVGEVSIYVAKHTQGQGVGKTLLAGILALSEDNGFWTIISQVFPENKASLALHGACGFQVVGTRDRIGHMNYGPLANTWRDTVLLERRSSIVGVGGATE